MAKVTIFWDPIGLELDAIGIKQYLKSTDGDTPSISLSIRMLSIDAPELHYENQNPSKFDGKLGELADWLQSEPAVVYPGLARYLYPKLATGKAGTLQEEQGNAALKSFNDLVMEKLTKPGGKKRPLFLRAADEYFDNYGRLLAYIAPEYSSAELATMSRINRATFNLMMVGSGWAASFPIYPSLPRHEDLVMLWEAAKEAYESKMGAWADTQMLTGYEFRMCVKLYGLMKSLKEQTKKNGGSKIVWIERYCVDMTTREIFYPQEYYCVPPYNRIFIWPKDVAQAVGRMNLVPPIDA